MRSPVQNYLESIVEQCSGTEGEVASYIPELAQADPDRFGLALATVDGHVYTVGQAETCFSIQSISKPFTYALALADQGFERVAEKVDVEPSGEAFNEISLASRTGRPPNPMINAGAITAASLVAGDSTDHRFGRVLEWLGGFAGRELELDEKVYTSELTTAHRNRAIAHMLREFDILHDDPEEKLDLYVRQCAVSVNTRDLAIMAATLANGGVQPVTEKRMLEPAYVERVLSVMATCGMYDAAGDWISAVGMPAKSGVSGGIIAVLPGQVGLAVFSPRLDSHGTSARGVQVCERMSSDMDMHLMHVGRMSNTAVRSRYPLSQVSPRRSRPEADQSVLDEHAERAMVYELHGDLLFAGAEHAVRSVVDDAPDVVILDVRKVDDMADVARATLLGLRTMLREVDAAMAVVDPQGVLPDPDAGTEQASPYFDDLDSAVRWCEGEVLRRHGREPTDERTLVNEHPLLRDLSDTAREVVDELMEELHFPADEVVLELGDGFSGVHVIVEGAAIATIQDRSGRTVRLVTMNPGTSFGELALGTNGVQDTTVRTVSDLTVLRLSAEAINKITAEQPQVALEMWRAMARDAYRVAERALRSSATFG
ncbi:glutaminase A [Nesterenkonia natronophila]|uniref:Glutaminase n=1 Tax=Nesterenkonia natronophila TaxID=2174932 RepID=A0A3A4F834_9MICC|nr:glutaminase A [Nesterenkonia natronophila]RJN32640.1 glutaminase A [Nesterenkonia natronophila]